MDVHPPKNVSIGIDPYPYAGEHHPINWPPTSTVIYFSSSLCTWSCHHNARSHCCLMTSPHSQHTFCLSKNAECLQKGHVIIVQNEVFYHGISGVPYFWTNPAGCLESLTWIDRGLRSRLWNGHGISGELTAVSRAWIGCPGFTKLGPWVPAGWNKRITWIFSQHAVYVYIYR